MAGPFGLGSAGSMQVNSQIVPVPMSGAFFPSSASAPFYKGSGQPPPTVALSYMGSSGGSSNEGAVNAAVANPFSFTDSPLVLAIIFILVGYLGLRYVHWKG